MEFSGKKFRAARKEAKVTLKQIANAAGVSEPAVSHWESGKNYPSKEALKTASELLGCNSEDFLASDDDVINQSRIVTRDHEGRVKEETRFDSAGNVYRHYYNLELTPMVWAKMQEILKATRAGKDIDGYLATLIHDDYKRVVKEPSNQLTDADAEAN